MKIKPDHYPVIIITTLVLFTILGFVLGFLPGHSSREEHGLLSPQVEFTSMHFGNNI
ncbi:MAG: hypothetical protein GQ555_04355 [Desulfobacterales bacterium]|nr:hypothetical protein [Desulfobacterales bacterium]